MRLKIVAGSLIAILLVGLGSYFQVKSELTSRLSSQQAKQLTADAELLSSSWQLSGLDFLNQVQSRARTRDVENAYRALDDNSRRRRAHEAANAISTWFRDPARGRNGAPGIVVLLDETGRVVARDQDPNRMGGQALVTQVPAIRGALNGEAVIDVWQEEPDNHKALRVAVAPVRNEAGGVVGALMVGYDMPNSYAARESERVGQHVAVIRDGQLYSSSLDQTVATSLSSAVTGALAPQVERAAAGNQERVSVTLGSKEYSGILQSAPQSDSANLVFAVLADQSEIREISGITMIILLLTGAGILIALGYGWFIGSSLMRPLADIEEGVLKVINGNVQHRIDVESAEFGGLAYRINQMINGFTGVTETDESGRAAATSGNWDTAPDEEEAQGEGGGNSAEAEALAAEDEGAYQDRLYQEYVSAKEAAGEDVSNIAKGKFLQRLSKNAEALKAKHGCRMVRFKVQARETQVVLQPVIIR